MPGLHCTSFFTRRLHMCAELIVLARHEIENTGLLGALTFWALPARAVGLCLRHKFEHRQLPWNWQQLQLMVVVLLLLLLLQLLRWRRLLQKLLVRMLLKLLEPLSRLEPRWLPYSSNCVGRLLVQINFMSGRPLVPSWLLVGSLLLHQ